jgi:hypothetical protein
VERDIIKIIYDRRIRARGMLQMVEQEPATAALRKDQASGVILKIVVPSFS